MTTEQENKQKRSKCPEMAYCLTNEIAVLGFVALWSHFGIRVSLVQVQIYFCRRSVTIFLTYHIQYLLL